MNHDSVTFLLSAPLSDSDLLTWLLAQGTGKTEPHVTVDRIYYDTFDWRLYLAGSVVESTAEGPGLRLQWRPLEHGDLLGEWQAEHAPSFADDLPSAPFRQQLASLIAPRTLLPQAHVRSEQTAIRLQNSKRRTIARLMASDHRLVDEEGNGEQALPSTLEIVAAKGHRKAAARICQQLAEEFSLQTTTQPLYVRALQALGRQPGISSSDFHVQLAPEMAAREAAKSILLNLLDTMVENEAGTRADLDSEFLHSFRVAVRRTRSALSQIKRVFPDQAVQHFQNEFRWLGQLTGPTRDLDVYILKFQGYQAELPSEIRTDLMPMRAFLLKHQAFEQQRLADALVSDRYRDLVQNWRTFLETSPVEEGAESPRNADRPIIDVANQRIWRVYKRLLKQGRAIMPETPAEALHELRISGKKLRYLMEFFQTLYPAAKSTRLIDTLKILQDNLGDFQDFEVQVMKLREFAQQMLEEGETPAVTIMAMGILVEHLVERQTQARDEFDDRFRRFAQPKNYKHFKALYRPRSAK